MGDSQKKSGRVSAPEEVERVEMSAAERELMRFRQLKAVESSAGNWKDRDHPELKAGSVRWVRGLRRENERRLKSNSR